MRCNYESNVLLGNVKNRFGLLLKIEKRVVVLKKAKVFEDCPAFRKVATSENVIPEIMIGWLAFKCHWAIVKF